MPRRGWRKVSCPACRGVGAIVDRDADGETFTRRCKTCKGRKNIWVEKKGG